MLQFDIRVGGSVCDVRSESMRLLSICSNFAFSLSLAATWAAYAQNSDPNAATAKPPTDTSTVGHTQVSGTQAVGNESVSVEPGMLEENRRALLEKIIQSKRLGVGVGPYMGAFAQIESMVKSGASPDAVQKRIDSVRASLMEQAKRIKDIKERPALTPTSVSSSSQSPAPAAGGVPGGLIDKLKEKFGDKIPDALNDPNLREKLSDPSVREKLMQSPAGQKILDKLQGQGEE